jgi:hypothetical protein
MITNDLDKIYHQKGKRGFQIKALVKFVYIRDKLLIDLIHH